MAGFVQNLLQDAAKIVTKEAGNAVKGFFTADYLRDYTHASKTFRAGSYGYAPKYKFLFHVYFDVNKFYIQSTQGWPEDQNFGLAVKNIDLPKFTFELETLNQYNRKRIVQTKVKYDPINITFHDDNQNLIRKLWYTYYTYYYKDATQPDINTPTSASITANTGLNEEQVNLNFRNIYEPNITNNDWGYVGEGGQTYDAQASAIWNSKVPFFSGINIYGFNQHNFVLYRLVNPIIETFTHDKYDYSQGNGVMENNMTIQYESVKYYEGAIDGRDPNKIVKGFGAEDHYDRTLSPIARPGSQGTIFGQGGLLNAAGGIMQDLENGNFVGAIQKAGASYNTFKNPQTILQAGRQEFLGAVSGSLSGTPNRNNQFGFPTDGSSVIQNAARNTNSWIKNTVSSPKPVPPTQ